MLSSTKPSNATGNGIRAACSSVQTSAIVPGNVRSMGRLTPQLEATLFRPRIQRGKVGKVRHALQHLVTGVADIILDLPLLPFCRRIAELRLIDIVVCHGEEAHVDLALLTPANTIHRRAHVIVNPMTRHVAKDP